MNWYKFSSCSTTSLSAASLASVQAARWRLKSSCVWKLQSFVFRNQCLLSFAWVMHRCETSALYSAFEVETSENKKQIKTSSIHLSVHFSFSPGSNIPRSAKRSKTRSPNTAESRGRFLTGSCKVWSACCGSSSKRTFFKSWCWNIFQAPAESD